MPSRPRLQCSLRSEASNPRKLAVLAVLNAAVKFTWKLIGLQNEETVIHSERFVDSWIEETFVWILVALAHG